jgi:hypothetical protein
VYKLYPADGEGESEAERLLDGELLIELLGLYEDDGLIEADGETEADGELPACISNLLDQSSCKR